MEIQIYADVLFFINFIMDFIVLFVTDRLMNTGARIVRLVVISMVMALIYCIFSFNFWQSYGMLFQLVVMAVMIFVAFKPDDLYMYLRLFAVVNVVALAVGGISLVLYFYDAYDMVVPDGSVHIFPLSVLISGTSIAVIIILWTKKWFNKKLLKAQQICNIKLYLKNNSVTIRALVDTGNSLTDPVTDKPVIIVGENIADKLLKNVDMYGIRLLPYKSLGNENGLLKGFNADRAEFEDKVILKPVIGIYAEKLCNNSAFNALISPEMINGGYDACKNF